MKTTPTAKPISPRPGRRAALSGRQFLALGLVALAGLLGLATLGLLLFSPAGALLFPPANLPPPNVPPANVPPPPAATPAPHTSTPGLAALTPIPPDSGAFPLEPIPAECARFHTGSQRSGTLRIIDAQVLEVTLPSETLALRLAGLEFGAGQAEAQAWLLNNLQGQQVLLVRDPNGLDQPGQQALYVFAGDVFINDTLIRLGYARAAIAELSLTCAPLFQQSEQMARADRLGIWSAPPVPTATFMPLVTLPPRTQPCDCSIRYECSDFRTQADAQACYNACNDYNSRLDSDRDGLACEALP